mmetsp:Transcript_57582/g.132252  ORF Transcript_57582/g.132252 Transcript_57582/m.132252 type:complete len:385 (-) Transcript_57582:725-1879(-)
MVSIPYDQNPAWRARNNVVFALLSSVAAPNRHCRHPSSADDTSLRIRNSAANNDWCRWRNRPAAALHVLSDALNKRLAGLCKPPCQHHLGHACQPAEVDTTHSQMSTEFVNEHRCARVSACRRIENHCGATASGPLRARLRVCMAREQGTGGHVRFPAAALPTWTVVGGFACIDDMVAAFASTHTAVGHNEAHSHARSECDHRDVGSCARRRADPPFRCGGGHRVVHERDRHVKAVLEQLREWYAPPARKAGCGTHDTLLLDQPWSSAPSCRHIAARKAELAQSCVARLQNARHDGFRRAFGDRKAHVCLDSTVTAHNCGPDVGAANINAKQAASLKVSEWQLARQPPALERMRRWLRGAVAAVRRQRPQRLRCRSHALSLRDA